AKSVQQGNTSSPAFPYKFACKLKTLMVDFFPEQADLVTKNPIRLQFIHAAKTADFFKIFPMILGSQNVRVQILGKALDALGLIDVKLQVVCVEVIVLENGSRMGAERLMDDGFNAVSGNDRLLREPLDVLGTYKLLGDHDDSLTRFCLFLILPSGAMDLRISLRVGNLYMNEGDIGIERPQEKILFACKWTHHVLYILGRRSCLESLQHFAEHQRFNRNE